MEIFVRHVLHGIQTTSGVRCEDKGKFTWVDIDGLVAGNRVHTHNGVNGFDGLTPHCLTGSACAICLGDCAVYSIEALEVLLETRAERRVQCVPVASNEGRKLVHALNSSQSRVEDDGT